MKVKNIWASDYAVIYEIDDKCYFYNKRHNETPSLSVDQEVSASQLGDPYKVKKHRFFTIAGEKLRLSSKKCRFLIIGG